MTRTKALIVILAVLLALEALTPRSAPPTSPSKPAIAPLPTPAKVKLLLFTQEGCPPCRALKAELSKADLSGFDLEEVGYPDPRFEEFRVTGTPALFALCASGQKRYAGGSLDEWLKSCRAKSAPHRPRKPTPKGAIVEAGPDGPGGRHAMEYPPEMWKENITSRGQGCCVQRSVDYMAHWQNVPQLWDFPEWVRSTGQPGGAYAELLAQRITRICKDRNMPEPKYLNVESKDFELLKFIVSTGRIAGVDYTGRDGVHYGPPIAHCVDIVYADDDYVAILDNNFPPNKLLWLTTDEFKKRWPGWIIALLAPRPPAAPHN